MRRNLTISLDQRFIELMDARRGVMPRSRWLEAAADSEGAAPVIERSPKPREEIEQARVTAESVASEAVRQVPPMMTGRQIEEKRQEEAGEG